MADDDSPPPASRRTEKPTIQEVANSNAENNDEANNTPVGVLSNPDLVGQHGAFEVVHASREEMQKIHEDELEAQANRQDAGQ